MNGIRGEVGARSHKGEDDGCLILLRLLLPPELCTVQAGGGRGVDVGMRSVLGGGLVGEWVG